jgi:glycosyltransferase involved in cell wall biosynthesis
LVVTNCNSNVELLSSKGGRAPFKVVEVGFDAADFRQSEIVKGETFNVVYTGTMASSYNPAVFIKAFKNLVNLAPDSVKWHIAGMLDPEIVAQIEIAGLTKYCVMYGYVAHHQAVELMSKAHVLLSIFPQTKNELGIPGKLFEYLAAHRTILNIAPKTGDSAQIITECDSGVTFERHEEAKVFEFLSNNFQNWQAGSLKSLGNDQVQKYSRHNLAKRFAEIIKSVD